MAEVNPNVVTHEVNIGGGKLIVADDLREGYKDEKSFGQLTEDVVGDLTGDNELAVKAGEDARETHAYRADLTIANMAKQQRKNKDQPYVRLFLHPNGHDTIMLACAWDSDKECQVAIIAHCWDTANGEWDHRILQKMEVRL